MTVSDSTPLSTERTLNLRVRDIQALSAALMAADAAGLLVMLAEGPASIAELADARHVDPRACTHILELMNAFGLTTRDGDRYRATLELAAHARRPAPLAALDLDLWKHAPTFLRTGLPLVTMDAAPTERQDIYRDVVPSLATLFAPAADQLAERAGLAPQAVLDMGCGSGVWSLAFATRFPQARVTGLDLPAVIGRFRERAASLGVADRTSTIEGDMHAAHVPSKQWDLVIIANVIRLEPEDRVRSLFERAVNALQTGGALLVVDALAAGSPAADQARALYAFHLAMRTRGGRVHAAADVRRWMEEAGCESPREVSFDAHRMAVGALAALVGRKA